MAEHFAPGSFLLDVDEMSGSVQKMHVTTDNKIVIESAVDITQLADQNKEMRNSVSRVERVGDFVRVGRMPMQVYLDLRRRGILRDRAEMRRWLLSDEALPYRTHWMAC